VARFEGAHGERAERIAERAAGDLADVPRPVGSHDTGRRKLWGIVSTKNSMKEKSKNRNS
jgi:hypothetical protein